MDKPTPQVIPEEFREEMREAYNHVWKATEGHRDIVPAKECFNPWPDSDAKDEGRGR